MTTLQLDRRQRETAVLAIIALITVVYLRLPLEPGPMLMAEVLTIALGFCGFVFALSKNQSSNFWSVLCTAGRIADHQRDRFTKIRIPDCARTDGLDVLRDGCLVAVGAKPTVAGDVVGRIRLPGVVRNGDFR